MTERSRSGELEEEREDVLEERGGIICVRQDDVNERGICPGHGAIKGVNLRWPEYYMSHYLAWIMREHQGESHTKTTTLIFQKDVVFFKGQNLNCDF